MNESLLLAHLIFAALAGGAFLFGLFLFKAPLNAFAIQKKFYAHINWNIEPISVSKEIRNTKLMGAFLMGFAVIAGLYYCFR